MGEALKFMTENLSMKDTGKMAKLMVMAAVSIVMVKFIKECSTKTAWKEKVFTTGRMVEYLRVPLLKVRNRVRVASSGGMVKFMKVTLKMMNVMALVPYFILMVRDLKEIGKKVISMVKVHSFSLMAKCSLSFTVMARKWARASSLVDLEELCRVSRKSIIR